MGQYCNRSDEHRAAQRKYYRANREKILAKQRAKRDSDEYRNYLKQYYLKNRGKEIAKTRRYQIAKLKAMPAWLSKEQHLEIEAIYNSTSPGYEVDHIIPLQGKTVCGLHVPWNLQVLTSKENHIKGNRI